MQNERLNQNLGQNDEQNNDELQDLLAALDKQAGLARPEFENGLYHAYMSEAGKGRSPIRGVWNLLTAKWAVAGMVTVALVVVAGLFIARDMQPTNQTNKLTPQTKAVLRQVLANNPQVVLSLQTETSPDPVISIPIVTQSTSTASSTPASADYQRVKTFNYSYTRNIIDFGAAKRKCAVFAVGREGVFEAYHYYDGQDSYLKSLTYSADEDLQDYYLQVPEYYIHYKQGAFAAKVELTGTDDGGNTSTTTRTATSITSVNSAETEQLAVNFFGEDVEVSDKKTEGDKEYYEIISRYEVECGATKVKTDQSGPSTASTSSTTKSQSTSAKPDIQTIVSVAKVDAETYEMFAKSDYLNEVSAKNLIRAMEIEQDTRSVTFQDIEKIFTFDYEVPIEDYVKGAAPEVTTERVMEVIMAESIPVIWPDNGKPRIRDVYIPEIWKTENLGNEYLLKRTFYPKGKIGDSMYEEVTAAEATYLQKELLDRYLLSMVFTWGDQRELSVSAYAPGTTIDALVKELLKSDEVEELDTETLSFTESRVNAKVIAPKQAAEQTKQRNYVFNWGGVNYVMVFSPISAFSEQQRLSALQFEVLSVNHFDEEKLRSQITAALENWYAQN